MFYGILSLVHGIKIAIYNVEIGNYNHDILKNIPKYLGNRKELEIWSQCTLNCK